MDVVGGGDHRSGKAPAVPFADVVARPSHLPGRENS